MRLMKRSSNSMAASPALASGSTSLSSHGRSSQSSPSKCALSLASSSFSYLSPGMIASLFQSPKNKTIASPRTTTSSTTGDESSTAELSDAWRAGNFLEDGPPRDDDWWAIEEEEDKGEEESSNSATRNRSFGTTKIRSKSSNSSSRSTVQQQHTQRCFRNRGLETWEKTREAWSSSNANSGVVTLPMSPAAKEMRSKHGTKPALPRYKRRELQRNIISERQFTLPRQVPLSEIISVYQNIWNEEHAEI